MVRSGRARRASQTTVHQRKRILVVDDDPTCRVLLDAIFDLHGFEVFASDSVLGATELIGSVRPDVILLDLALPYRSGASWLTELKSRPDTATIPVIILSAMPEMLPGDRRRLAAAVLQKPFRTPALVETVRAACARPTLPVAQVSSDGASSQRLGSL